MKTKMDAINPTVASTKRLCSVNSTMFSAITLSKCDGSLGFNNSVGLASSMFAATSSKLLSS
jgi:ethanolamine utilization microcompartment shell protein EutL